MFYGFVDPTVLWVGSSMINGTYRIPIIIIFIARKHLNYFMQVFIVGLYVWFYE